MKLYTEEQVLKIIQKTVMDKPETYYEVLKYYTPIELPSDDDIEKELLKHSNITQIDPYKPFYFNAAMFGAKWMKEQILNQNK